MYIKKSKIIISVIAIILITSFITICAINPFGIANTMEFLNFSIGTRLIELMYYDNVDMKNAAESALAGVALSTGDPYTGYIWGEDAVEYMEDIEGNYCGVGMYIEWDSETDLISVVSPIAGSPAEKAGIAPGDKILKIDGVPYVGSQLNEASSYMRGEEGTSVTLTMRSEIDMKEYQVTLTRSHIVIDSISGKMLNNNIGYISISQFIENTSANFASKYSELKHQGMKSLVLDLRNNPGGMLNEAVSMASFFVEDNQIVTYTLDKFEEKEEYFSDYIDKENKVNIPVVVLINGGSASASEVLTGALRDYGLATIIGEKSYGKGVVQNVFPFGDGLISVTISRYYTPKGECIHGTGITPDIIASMPLEKTAKLTSLDPNDDEQLMAAIKHLQEN
ncbi:MAG: S41 family peptidase [Ruminococcaceae bacterium]|nr:S41 family peptidase [Oscillospiraceae bacterium]